MRTRLLAAVLCLAALWAPLGGYAIQDLDLDCVMPGYIIAADLNQDGYPDLAVACHSCNTITFLPNLGADMPSPCQAFDAGRAVDWVLNDAPMALAAGQFLDAPIYVPECPPVECSDDGNDTRPGWYFPYYAPFPSVLAVTQFQPGLLRISPIENQPPMRELVEGDLRVNRVGSFFATLTHLATADLTGDGVLDVVVLDGITPQLAVFRGERDPIDPAVAANTSASHGPNVVIPLPGYKRASFVVIADFDRDGRLDLAVAADGSVLFFKNTAVPSSASFTLVHEVVVGTHVKGLAVADFNRNGYPDVAAVDPEFGALSIIRNHGCWDLRLEQRLKIEGGPVFVAAIDADRNGLVDLAVAEQHTNQVTIVLNELVGHEDFARPDRCGETVDCPEQIDTTEFFVSHSFRVGEQPVGLAVADFNRDGILDIAVALKGGGPAGSGPAVQIIYNPSCCPDCDGQIRCCPESDSERDTCPELLGTTDPKGLSWGPLVSVAPARRNWEERMTSWWWRSPQLYSQARLMPRYLGS